ncbi:MAG: hypothetical protein II638_04400, partial [Erysipelotrichaceae bacterium]|nr:hypothetical protein [Erysipelotrichaceae bacterium]
ACALFSNDLIDYELKNHKDYADQFFQSLQIDAQELKGVIAALVPDFDIHMSDEEITTLLPRYENNNSVKNTYGRMNIEDIKKVLSKFR